MADPVKLREAAAALERLRSVELWRGKTINVDPNLSLQWSYANGMGGCEAVRGKVEEIVGERLEALIADAVAAFETEAR